MPFRPPEPCLGDGGREPCRSIVACSTFGYCRERNLIGDAPLTDSLARTRRARAEVRRARAAQGLPADPLIAWHLSAHDASGFPLISIVWRCACGWKGKTEDLKLNVQADMRYCPTCGGTGGLIANPASVPE